MAKIDEDLGRERQFALFEAYKAARARLYKEAKTKEDFSTLHQRAIIEAIHTPQPRFWISQYRTYRLLGMLLNRPDAEALQKTYRHRKAQRAELLSAYHRLVSRRMFKGMPLLFVASFVTFEPCSGFFMSVSRAGRAIHNEMIRRREERAKK